MRRRVLFYCFVRINQSFTLYLKASPFWSWVCLGSSLTEHLSLWCHRWHSDDPDHPVWHVGYSPAMTSLRQTQYQTEHCCSSHYSSCRDREGFICMETGFRLAFRLWHLFFNSDLCTWAYFFFSVFQCSDLTVDLNESYIIFIIILCTDAKFMYNPKKQQHLVLRIQSQDNCVSQLI